MLYFTVIFSYKIAYLFLFFLVLYVNLLFCNLQIFFQFTFFFGNFFLCILPLALFYAIHTFLTSHLALLFIVHTITTVILRYFYDFFLFFVCVVTHDLAPHCCCSFSPAVMDLSLSFFMYPLPVLQPLRGNRK